MTLLAFGAGAPDVFASLSASEGADLGGIQLGISVLLGSSLFILATVTAAVLIGSPADVALNKWFFMRDTFFLLVAQLGLIYCIKVRQVIDMQASIGFVCVYAVYVAVVII